MAEEKPIDSTVNGKVTKLAAEFETTNVKLSYGTKFNKEFH